MKNARKMLGVGIIFLFVGASVVSGLQVSQPLRMKDSNRGNTIHVGGAGPGNYSSIQGGINAASNGDTVFVYDDSSPYHEDLIVDKSINLLGEYQNTTIIDGGGGEVVVNVTADNVTMSDFTIQYSNNSEGRGYTYGLIFYGAGPISPIGVTVHGFDYGILLKGGSVHWKFAHCTIYNNRFGITVGGGLRGSSYNTIENSSIFQNIEYGISINGGDETGSFHNKIIYNWIEQCGAGIVLYYNSNNNEVYNNVILHSEGTGISLSSSANNNLIHDNVLDSNAYGISIGSSQGNDVRHNDIYSGNYGIHVYESSLNNVNNNTIHNNEGIGIYLSNSQHNLISHNIITFNQEWGIYLSESSDNNIISSNDINNNSWDGIGLYQATNNEIRSNSISHNIRSGLRLDVSSGNTIEGNRVYSNGVKGIWITSGCYKNHIVNNYFDNTDNAMDDGNSNVWADPITTGLNILGGPHLGGNYWSDYHIFDSIHVPPPALFNNVKNDGRPSYNIPGTAGSQDIHPLPGFELLGFIAAFAIALIMLRAKKGK